MSVNPRGGRRYTYSGPPLADDQGVTGQEVDTPPPPPPRYDNADGYEVPIRRSIIQPITEYPYDDVERPYERGRPIERASPMADADDYVKNIQARWASEAHARGNEVRYTSEGVFEVDP